jgi:dTDP-4-dehydrorhamnose 3,5-epimerase
MQITPTDFPDVYILEPRVFPDKRGYFLESFNENILASAGIHYHFCQDNHSKSFFGVLRGLHFQKGVFSQTKLVRVVSGVVLDVAVDLRKGSPTYLKHLSLELSAANNKQLLIPKGFAHGFVVLSEEADFLYKCDSYYNKEAEGGVVFNDPQLAINWQIATDQIIINDKDAANPLLKDADFDFPFEAFTGEKLYAQ